jgi:hypothetical protein
MATINPGNAPLARPHLNDHAGSAIWTLPPLDIVFIGK